MDLLGQLFVVRLFLGLRAKRTSIGRWTTVTECHAAAVVAFRSRELRGGSLRKFDYSWTLCNESNKVKNNGQQPTRIGFKSLSCFIICSTIALTWIRGEWSRDAKVKPTASRDIRELLSRETQNAWIDDDKHYVITENSCLFTNRSSRERFGIWFSVL